MGNIFVSFLGTGRYEECNYQLDGYRPVKAVRFVQEAFVRLLGNDFSENDRILVFLTSEAREKNWQDRQEENGGRIEGLQSRLAACDIKATVHGIDIPAGRSPEELWQIFSTVFAQLRHRDRVFFDITHAFRSIPMLGVVLLNYARLLKDIDIAGIYYGAYEARDDDGNAPVFDLTDFATLMEWTSGVQEFVRHGNPAAIAELLEGAAVPRLIESRGRDQTAKLWRDTAGCLRKISGQVTTNRGAEIVEGYFFSSLQERLTECEAMKDLPQPFRPLIGAIRQKTAGFGNDEARNCLQAVRWCLGHGLVQQGLTMLQEGVVTMLCQRFDLDWREKTDRDLISGALNVVNRELPENGWNATLKGRKEDARRIVDDPRVKQVASTYDRLSKTRNDINHGGFCKPRSAEKLNQELERCCHDVADLFSA